MRMSGGRNLFRFVCDIDGVLEYMYNSLTLMHLRLATSLSGVVCGVSQPNVMLFHAGCTVSYRLL
jgi:hypothetical protein